MKLAMKELIKEKTLRVRNAIQFELNKTLEEIAYEHGVSRTFVCDRAWDLKNETGFQRRTKDEVK
ncbi:MAG: hypothetical protein M3O09_03305 [Acidobacteriota bacterium]|nr:hypothetical protein [Acidobacteriota bacterium]